MRSVTRWVLAAVLTVAAAGAAIAQPPGGGRGGFGMMMGGGGAGMLYSQLPTSKILAEELKISDEQKDKLKKDLEPLVKEQREMMMGMFRPGGERPSPEEMKERGEKMQKMSADMKKAADAVLKPEQTKRLTEISYQQAGLAAFAVKEVKEALKLTEGQEEKIKGVAEQYGKDMMELGFGGRGQGGERPNREEMQKRMAESQKKRDALTKDAMEKISEILKDDQKDTWKGLVGKKFDTAKLQEEQRANMMRQFRRDD